MARSRCLAQRTRLRYPPSRGSPSLRSSLLLVSLVSGYQVVGRLRIALMRLVTDVSDNDLTNEVVEELRQLAQRLAEDIGEEADSVSRARSSRSTRVTEGDVTSVRLRLTAPLESRSARVTRVIQFAIMTLVLSSIVFLVFELTAKSLTHAESAALVIVTIGFFYVVVNVTIYARREFSRQTANAGRWRGSHFNLQVSPTEESAADTADSEAGLLDTVLHDEKMTTRLGYLIRQSGISAVGVLAAVSGLIYLGIHHFASVLQYIVAFGSALLLGITSFAVWWSERKQRKRMEATEDRFATLMTYEELVETLTRKKGSPKGAATPRQSEVDFSVLMELARIAPRPAIIESWGLLEYQLNVVADRLSPKQGHGWPEVAHSLEALDEWPLLYPAVLELRRLRDYTVHTVRSPSSSDAARYVSTVQDLVIILLRVVVSLPQSGSGRKEKG